MNDMPEQTQGRIADLPLAERRRLEIEKQRELEEGFNRRLVSIATYEQRCLAVQLARVLDMGRREG